MSNGNPSQTSVQTPENFPDGYFGLNRRQPPKAECEQMKKNLASVFEKDKYKSVLYVGANKRRQYFLDWFEKANYDKIVVLEAFKENVDCLKANSKGWTPALDIIHGDIRDAEFTRDRFDVVMFWHGPEHLSQKEITPVLQRLESMANVVILGCPYGVYLQGAEYNNPYEEHLSHLYPHVLEKMGYTVDTIGEAGQNTANILAWKFMSSEHGTQKGAQQS